MRQRLGTAAIEVAMTHIVVLSWGLLALASYQLWGWKGLLWFAFTFLGFGYAWALSASLFAAVLVARR